MSDDEDDRHLEIRDLHNRTETLMECCWCCGTGMISVSKRAEWMAKYPELQRLASKSPDEAGT